MTVNHSPISSPLCSAIALLATSAVCTADAIADTTIISFDAGTIPPDLVCEEVWFEGDVGLRVVPTPLETCGLSLCVFSDTGGALGLGVSQLRVDLSLIAGAVDSVDVSFSTVCFECVDVAAFDGDALVATTTNETTSGMISLDVGGAFVDRLEVNPCIDFRLEEIVIHRCSTTSTSGGDGGLEHETRLGVLPTPLRVSASIPIRVGDPGHVDLGIFGPSGRHLRSLLDSALPAGRYYVVWDGADARGRALPPGSYFFRLRLDGVVVDTRRTVLLR